MVGDTEEGDTEGDTEEDTEEEDGTIFIILSRKWINKQRAKLLLQPVVVNERWYKATSETTQTSSANDAYIPDTNAFDVDEAWSSTSFRCEYCLTVIPYQAAPDTHYRDSLSLHVHPCTVHIHIWIDWTEDDGDMSNINEVLVKVYKIKTLYMGDTLIDKDDMLAYTSAITQDIMSPWKRKEERTIDSPWLSMGRRTYRFVKPRTDPRQSHYILKAKFPASNMIYDAATDAGTTAVNHQWLAIEHNLPNAQVEGATCPLTMSVTWRRTWHDEYYFHYFALF